jgi:hypothetical protein
MINATIVRNFCLKELARIRLRNNEQKSQQPKKQSGMKM